MLRRLDLKASWRSLDPGFWPEDLPLGNRTVVYGHNGSGKSTVAELLLTLADGQAATEIIWENEDGQHTKVRAGTAGPSPSMSVFTRKWVEANLSDFLDGENASAIVTLGQEAIHAKEEEAQLETEIEQLQEAATESAEQQEAADKEVDKLANEVQAEIIAHLREFDYKHFTRNRYSLPRVKEELRNYTGEFPDSNAHAEALMRLGEGALDAVAEMATPPADIVEDLSRLSTLLAETPTRVALASLEGNPTAQAWVEQGLTLHGELDHCLFCAGPLSDERRRELAQHFDESWLQLRESAQALLAAVTREKEKLRTWASSLPAAELLSSSLQATYQEATEGAAEAVAERIVVLEKVEKALRSKAEDPSTTPEVPDWTSLTVAISTAVLKESISEHNDQVRRHEEVTAGHKETVFHHLVGVKSEAFRELEEQAKTSQIKSRTSTQAAGLAQRRLEEVRRQRFTTACMADTLTRDLARVYGKHHLSITLTDDGKSYSCRRGGEPATHLSEGERTTLSLLYFLRKLEDESQTAEEPSQRIVVIDDPSSSLDREALFATHQWLIDTLATFGQYVVLTHDFGLLRLFVKSQKNRWDKSTRKIQKGDVDEKCFPQVAFLEIFAAGATGKRGSRVGQLPRLLANNTSEYAYLFSMIMAGVADTEDHERLFLLPNATRRVLEIFTSYKVPHLNNFDQQLGSLIKEVEDQPYRDVYDFCNRHSHGEGIESIDLLDARAVHGQIRRCMEFLKSVDKEHFERMCKATNVDQSILT